MSNVQMHLALTHVPVVLSIVGLVMLAVALIIKNNTIIRTSYVLISVAGIAAIPVFFSGEGAEESIENLPSVSEAVIERHEELAKLAMIAIASAGVVALAALISFKSLAAGRILRFVVLVLAVVSGALMAQTAHLGGQIRHTEIRKGMALQNGNDAGSDNDGNTQKEQGQDDD